MGKAIPLKRYREIGSADGRVKDVAERYGVAMTTVYKARSFVTAEIIRRDQLQRRMDENISATGSAIHKPRI